MQLSKAKGIYKIMYRGTTTCICCESKEGSKRLIYLSLWKSTPLKMLGQPNSKAGIAAALAQHGICANKKAVYMCEGNTL